MILLFFFIIGVVYSSSNSALNYGEFDLRIDQFIPCKGPKQKNCAVVKAQIVNDSHVFYDMTVTQNMKPTKGKITASSNGKLLVRLQGNNPCNHIFLRPLFESMFNITDNCVILKGHYNMHLDIGEIARTYYQGAFIYGNLTFKSMFFNEDCNLSCTHVTVTLSPKKTAN